MTIDVYLWASTLTARNLDDGHRGCANSKTGNSKCSDDTTLSEDEFTYEGTTYTVTSI